MLFTSSSRPQPDRSTTAARNSHSVRLRRSVGKVGTEVLDQDLATEEVLHVAHAGREMLDGFLGVRQRQQVVEMLATRVTPAGVLAHERRLKALDRAFHARKVGRIERRRPIRGRGRRRAG